MLFIHSPLPPPHCLRQTPCTGAKMFQAMVKYTSERHSALIHPKAALWRLSVFPNSPYHAHCHHHPQIHSQQRNRRSGALQRKPHPPVTTATTPGNINPLRQPALQPHLPAGRRRAGKNGRANRQLPRASHRHKIWRPLPARR